MLRLEYSGWFQCRLATDPDPCDEPRGVSGWTYAMPGEPDLDRVLRFHDPVAPRVPGPTVGVTVNLVEVDGADVAGHPLVGARVELLGDPVFEGRNNLVAGDGREPIVPLDIRISGGGITLRREDLLDGERRRVVERVDGRLVSVGAGFVQRRTGAGGQPGPDLLAASGISDVAAHHQQRMADLRATLQATTDPVAKAALQRRIQDWAKPKLGSPQPGVVPIKVPYSCQIGELGGAPPEVTGDAPALGDPLEEAAAWTLELALGVWDADALCGG
jgi:hypothetical protein